MSSPALPARNLQPADMVSLAERMVFMQLLRVALVAVVLGSTIFATNLVHAEIGELALATTAYLLCSAAIEALRRSTGARSIRALSWMLLADGLYIAFAMYVSGGTQSPLRFLAFIHLIAVTLATSHRTGLKIALWHSLLFFVLFYTQASGWVTPGEHISTAQFHHNSVFNVLALWLVALTTATFSRLNERELKKRQLDFRSLAGLGGALQTVQNAQDAAASVVAAVRNGFGFPSAAVFGGQDEGPVLLAADPAPPVEVVHVVEDELVARVMDDDHPVLVKRIDPVANPTLARLLPFGRNVIVLPMVADGRSIGALVVEYGGRAGRVERRVVSLLEQFAGQASLALRNAWLLEQVNTLARTDSLTGVANRRTFEDTLGHELSRAMRTGDSLSLVMLDVDHFKMFNDTHGHRMGDKMLQAVTAALAAESRDFDTVARYGGEEFAVILPGCSSRQCLAAAERLRKGIAAIDEPARITASAGVATFPTHAADVESLVKAADEALYESKRTGRDRVTRSRRRGPRRRASEVTSEVPA